MKPSAVNWLIGQIFDKHTEAWKDVIEHAQAFEQNALQSRDELIQLLLDQVSQLSTISKIELGDDVLAEIHRLRRKADNTYLSNTITLSRFTTTHVWKWEVTGADGKVYRGWVEEVIDANDQVADRAITWNTEPLHDQQLIEEIEQAVLSALK